MYRVGYPFWKALARFGVPVLVRVYVFHDEASNSYWAKSPDLDGLIVSGQTLDEVQREAVAAARSLLEIAVDGRIPKAKTELSYREDTLCAA